MKFSKKVITVILLAGVLALGGCGTTASVSESASPSKLEEQSAEASESGSEAGAEAGAETDKEPVTIMVAVAASLEYSYTEKLIPLFQEKYPWITVKGTYDSSGKLQTQIEEGLEADVFMSAAMKQMTALRDAGLVTDSTIVDLLENKIVMIKPADGVTTVTGFADAQNAATIALGDPDSVPVGQYAQEAFTTLGNWDAVLAKTSKGTNVTEVLNWVAAGSAEIGVVYATDAATKEVVDKITILAEAPKDSLATQVIYPVGMVTASTHPEEAQLFIDFLRTDDALDIFTEYGFTPNK